MGNIKSAREIAMEKIDSLKGLTPEELKEKEEKRYQNIGKALADKYIEGLNLKQLKVDLDKYSDEEREMLCRTIISSLASSIELGGYERLEKILKGISYLNRKELSEETVEEIKNLFQEYGEVRKEATAEMEGSAAQILLQMGISGNAIAKVNTKTVDESYQLPDRIGQPFRDRLERLKSILLA